MASPTPLLSVASSGVHGVGAFATADIAADTLIGTYAGRRFTPDQLMRQTWDSQVTYLFSLSNGQTIDGARGGNATRHINHACRPNCQAVEESGDDGRLRVKIYALEAIRRGDELFLDYGLIIDESERPSDYPCRCGAPECRGTMVARVEG